MVTEQLQDVAPEEKEKQEVKEVVEKEEEEVKKMKEEEEDEKAKEVDDQEDQEKEEKVEVEEKKEEEGEQVVLPSDQWRPVHPDPLVLCVLVSDADPEGVPVASGQEVPHEGLAGGAAGGQGRSEEDFLPPPSGVLPAPRPW